MTVTKQFKLRRRSWSWRTNYILNQSFVFISSLSRNIMGRAEGRNQRWASSKNQAISRVNNPSVHANIVKCSHSNVVTLLLCECTHINTRNGSTCTVNRPVLNVSQYSRVECYVLRVNGDVNNYKISIFGLCGLSKYATIRFSRTIRSRILDESVYYKNKQVN